MSTLKMRQTTYDLLKRCCSTFAKCTMLEKHILEYVLDSTLISHCAVVTCYFLSYWHILLQTKKKKVLVARYWISATATQLGTLLILEYHAATQQASLQGAIQLDFQADDIFSAVKGMFYSWCDALAESQSYSNSK